MGGLIMREQFCQGRRARPVPSNSESSATVGWTCCRDGSSGLKSVLAQEGRSASRAAMNARRAVTRLVSGCQMTISKLSKFSIDSTTWSSVSVVWRTLWTTSASGTSRSVAPWSRRMASWTRSLGSLGEASSSARVGS